MEEAAAQGVAGLTVSQMLWQSQSGLPTPENPGDYSTWVRSLSFLIFSLELT